MTDEQTQMLLSFLKVVAECADPEYGGEEDYPSSEHLDSNVDDAVTAGVNWCNASWGNRAVVLLKEVGLA